MFPRGCTLRRAVIAGRAVIASRWTRNRNRIACMAAAITTATTLRTLSQVTSTQKHRTIRTRVRSASRSRVQSVSDGSLSHHRRQTTLRSVSSSFLLQSRLRFGTLFHIPVDLLSRQKLTDLRSRAERLPRSVCSARAPVKQDRKLSKHRSRPATRSCCRLPVRPILIGCAARGRAPLSSSRLALRERATFESIRSSRTDRHD